MQLLGIDIPALDFEHWLQNVSALEMVVKGLIIGVVVSAPMGPVGVLTVQRTLNKGRWQGFATGCGAALSDILYAVVTGCGLSFVFDIIEDVRVAFWIKLVGGCVLFLFGLYTFRSKPGGPQPSASDDKGKGKSKIAAKARASKAKMDAKAKAAEAKMDAKTRAAEAKMDAKAKADSSSLTLGSADPAPASAQRAAVRHSSLFTLHSSLNKKVLLQYGVSGFLWTVSNPLIVLLYVALFSQFTFVLPDHPFPQVVGYASIVAGALCWWFFLTWLIDKVRVRFQHRGISIINRVIGLCVMVGSACMVLYTIGVLSELNDIFDKWQQLQPLQPLRMK